MLILAVSCQKDDAVESEKNNKEKIKPNITLYAGATPATWDEVDNQMRWIARGLAYSARDYGLKHEVHSECDNTGEYEFMQPIEDAIESNVGYSLQLSHEDSLNTNIPANTYDRTYLPGFKMGGVDFNTFILIPNVATVDTGQTLVIVPENGDFWHHKNDTVKGYYFNQSSNSLDSLDLIGKEAPTDQYYIWVVNYTHQYTAFNKTIGRDIEGGCRNGYCEPSLGEDSTNCVDCMPVDPLTLLPRDIKHRYDIEVEEIEVYDDDAPYMESWLAGDYDFWAAGCMFQNDTIVDSEGQMEHDGTEYKETIPIFMGKVDRSDVCRTNSSGISKNCPSTPKIIQNVLFEDVTEDDKLICLFFEGKGGMPAGRGWFNNNQVMVGKHDLFNPDLPDHQNLYYLTTHRNDKATAPFFDKSNEETPPGQPWYNSNYTIKAAVPINLSEIITINDFDPSTNFYTFDNGEFKVKLRLRPI